MKNDKDQKKIRKKERKLKRNKRKIAQKNQKKQDKQGYMVILAFLLGSFFSELSSDPTDFIYFLRQRTGIPLTPFEQGFYWYLLTASLYLFLFFVAYFSAKTKRIKPRHIVYLLLILTISGGILSLFTEIDFPFMVIVIIATVVSIGVLLGVRNQIKDPTKPHWIDKTINNTNKKTTKSKIKTNPNQKQRKKRN